MRILIDEFAGVCPGVDRAIRMIEEHLKSGPVTALGSVIHNAYEVNRLSELGLKTREQEILEQENGLKKVRSEKLFIRTHGVPKAYYEKLNREHADYVDGTCPIVKRLQRTVQRHYEEGYQIIIVGKAHHPEVMGLLGFCENKGVVIRGEEDFSRIDMDKKSVLISQTTISQKRFFEIRDRLLERMPQLKVLDTTCRHITRRHDVLAEFASNVDIVFVVGGKKSSNTGVLYDICHRVNPRSYRIQSAGEIHPEWLHRDDVVGITGGASTPKWQLELVRDYLEMMEKSRELSGLRSR